MKKKLMLGFFVILFCYASAQKEELIELEKYCKNEIEIPIYSFIDQPVNGEIDVCLLNKLILIKQDVRAKFYSKNDTLYNITTYGKIPEEPMKWRTWADETKTKRIEKEFRTRAYSLGFLNLDKNYYAFVVKVVGFEKTYVDLYLFDKSGKLKSLINLFEANYVKNGDPSKFANIIIQSSLTNDKIVKWQENRFNVKTSRDYKLQFDGYFKIINQISEGTFGL